MFIIDVEREGLSYSAIDKVGTQTLSACSVFFDNVRIEPHELVGTLDKGFASCWTCSIPSASSPRPA